MITDSQTNVLYLSSLLKDIEPFYSNFTKLLRKNNVNPILLEGTKSIWCRDYMPIQVAEDKFVQFIYNPGYFQGKWEHLIFDPGPVTKSIGIETLKTNIKIDGGNIIRSKDKVILTDKIFRENLEYDEKDLVNDIRELLEVETLIIFPRVPWEATGHADGILRFVNEDTVIINDFKDQSNTYMNAIDKTLKKYHFNAIRFPYEPSASKNKYGDYTAKGVYINYLHIGNLIILPTFGQKEDESAFNKLQKVFPTVKIETINSNQISEDGGVLNCISWNIYKNN